MNKSINDPDKAIENYKNAIAIVPRHKHANINLGLALENKTEFDDALDQYKKALEWYPDDKELYVDVAAVYEKKGDFNAALEAYQEIIKRYPADAEIYNIVGTIYMVKFDPPDYIQAENSFLKALSYTPDHQHANRNLGLAYYELNKTEQAVAQFQKSLDILKEKEETDKSYYADLYNDLGNISLEVKSDARDAIEYYKKAVNEFPNHLYSNRNLGLAYDRLGKFDDAVEQFKKTLLLLPKENEENYDPSLVSALNNDLGIVYVNKEKFDIAIEHYKKALETDKENKHVVYNLGYANEKGGYLEEATGYYKEAIRLDVSKDFMGPYRQLAFLFFQQGIYSSAFEVLKSAEPHFNNSAEFLNDLGNLYFDSGQYGDAENYYKKALSKQNDYPLAQHNIAYLHEKWGNYEEARTQWEKAFDLYEKGLPKIQDSDHALHLYYYAEAKFYSFLEDDLDKIEGMYKKVLELEGL